jgi:hypothetical protein
VRGLSDFIGGALDLSLPRSTASANVNDRERDNPDFTASAY